MPSTLFTDPELAHVGLTEKQAAARGFEIQILKVPVTQTFDNMMLPPKTHVHGTPNRNG